MKTKAVCLVALLLSCVWLPVQAGTVVCAGTVEYLGYHSGIGNGLMLKLSSMNTSVFICDPDDTWTVSGTPYTTRPNACKAMWAALMAAKAAGTSFGGIYFDGDDAPADCSTWGNWKRANVRYYVY